MAMSTCVKCGSHSFEVVQQSPAHAQFKLFFVQCSACGGVVGVQDFYNLGSLLKDQEGQINSVKSTLSNIESYIAQLSQRLR